MRKFTEFQVHLTIYTLKLFLLYPRTYCNLRYRRFVKHYIKQFYYILVTYIQRPGPPADLVTEEIVEKIHDMILVDRRTKVREVAEAVCASYGTAINILHYKCMRKVSPRQLPRQLTVDNKRIRLSISKQCLDLFKRNSQEFLCRVVTVDETWIHYYTPEIKRQSKHLFFKHTFFRGESASKKAKTVPSVGKVMATMFGDSKRKIPMDFLQNGKTITGQYQSELLD